MMRTLLKRNIVTVTSILVICFSSAVAASTINEAFQASQNNQIDEAIKIWDELANKGNSTARFNLANHYQHGVGVEQNDEIAEKWFKSATRSGLVEAYLHFNKNALAAANGITIKLDVGPAEWLDQQDQTLYTIQLASSKSEALIKKYYLENDIKNEGGYYHYVRDGIDRYALVFGVYESVAAANTAIANFPEKLRKWTPWVRNIHSLQNISK